MTKEEAMKRLYSIQFQISEILVDVSKMHITPEQAFERMRTVLEKYHVSRYEIEG